MPPASRRNRTGPTSRISAQGEIVLTLSAREDLFSVPDLDPFEGQFATTSGIERISRKLAAMPLGGQPPHLCLRLPEDEITPQAVDETRRALQAFSAAELEQINERRAALSRERLRSTIAGLAFLALCLALSTTIEGLELLPDWMSWFMVEGLVIGGWVALWHPLELWLYAGWPLRHEDRVMRALAEMPVRVEPK